MKISEGWQKRSLSDIMYTLDSDAEKGLNKNKIILSRHKWGRNDLWYTGSPFMFFRSDSGFSVLGYLIMAIAAFSSFAFGKCNDAVFVGLALLAGVIIFSAFYAVTGLLCKRHSAMWIPVCKVIRNGKTVQIRATELVLGDVVILEEGCRVSADVKLITSEGITVKEPPFTKRRGPVSKAAAGVALTADGGAAPEDYIYAGSEIISGSGRAVVCSVGTETAQGKRGKIKLIPDFDPAQLTFARKRGVFLGALAMMFSFVAVALGVFSPIAASDFIGLFLVFLSFSVSAAGEIVPALCCFSYYSSIKKASDSGVFLRDTAGVDYFANCDGISVENTSYMKSDETKLCAVWVSGELLPHGDTKGDEILSLMLAGTCYGKGKYGREILLAAGEHIKGRIDPAKFIVNCQNNKPVLEHKIVGATQYSLYVFGYEQYFAVTGSIEEVISKCTKIRKNGLDVPIDREHLGDILKSASECLKTASSIIAVAERVSPYNNMKRLSSLTSDLTFIGFIAMDTPAFEGIPSSLAYLRESNIRFCLFTDGSGEDINFARKLGIISNRDNLTDGGDPDDAVANIFAEGSNGGAVYCVNDSVIGSVLNTAKKAGKRIVYVGGGDHIKDAGFAVVYDRPVTGSAAYIKQGSNLGSVTDAFIKLRKIGVRLGYAYLYLFISAIVRAAYAISLIFGLVYVYPSLILLWGLVLDSIVSALIISLHLKEK